MESTHRTLYGGGAFRLKLKVGATISNAGTIVIGDGTNNRGECIPCTTTSFLDSYGVSLDTATYSAVQADAEGIVTVDARPDQIIRARISGSSTTGADMTELSNTSESTAGTTVTDADVGTAAMVPATLWCIGGNNVGLSRIVTTHNSGTDMVVTVAFPRTIAVNDTFLFAPYSRMEAAGGNIQATATDFLDANGAIVVGTGGIVAVVDLEMNKAGTSYVNFVLQDHGLLNATL